LTLPGDDEHKLGKASASEADEVILDLEDSVAQDREQAAREIVARALTTLEWRAPLVAVRVNGRATRWHSDDMELIRAIPVTTVVLPKGGVS
jgi:citrate lyase beta subunit